MGGKGSQRIRQKKKSSVKKDSDNKKIRQVITKLGANILPDISTINLFTDDNKVISFTQPEVHGSFQNKTMIVLGNPEIKDLKDCFADVITEISPAQLASMKKQGIVAETEPVVAEEKKEVVPNFEDKATA